MPCLNCNKDTTNPKFCSSSCAASFNNRKPKRSRSKICRVCPALILSNEIHCDEHKPRIDLRINSNQGKNASVRSHARTTYSKSGRPYVCCLCGYSTHVDICHIKDIRTYTNGTLYSVVNDLSNLIPLCKNHHWEFDHDIL